MSQTPQKTSPSDSTIYASCEAANDALGPCPRALAESDGGHWWYIDNEAEKRAAKRGGEMAFIYCVCKSCPQKMRLDVQAEEYPI